MTYFLIVLLVASINYAKASDPSFSKEKPLVVEIPSNSTKMDKSWCNCRLKIFKKIVGGKIIKDYYIPWQATLANPDSIINFCGAIIINQNHILTAAHCVNDLKKDEIKVRFGFYDIKDPNIKARTYDVKDIIVHPWVDENIGDIAILELTKDIEFIPYQAEPACLNFTEKNYTYKLMISGYGKTSNKKNEVSRFLKVAFLSEYKNNCNKSMICVKSDNGDSPCDGDSGGPIHYYKNGRVTVEGIAAIAFDLTEPGKDAIPCFGKAAYSRLSYYKKWLEERIGDNYCTLKTILD